MEKRKIQTDKRKEIENEWQCQMQENEKGAKIKMLICCTECNWIEWDGYSKSKMDRKYTEAEMWRCSNVKAMYCALHAK